MRMYIILVFVAGGDVDAVVAFTAYAYNTSYTLDGSVVTFDEILTNIGDAFQADIGRFTCPISGVYVFYSAVTSPDLFFFFADLYRNEEYLITVKADEQGVRQSRNMAATECNAGYFSFFHDLFYLIRNLL